MSDITEVAAKKAYDLGKVHGFTERESNLMRVGAGSVAERLPSHGEIAEALYWEGLESPGKLADAVIELVKFKMEHGSVFLGDQKGEQ